MTGTSIKRLNAIRDEIERLIDLCAPLVPADFTQAIQSFLVALDYKDATLMRSHFEAGLDILADTITKELSTRISASAAVREGYQKAMSGVEGEPLEPSEALDGIGRKIDDVSNRVLSTLITSRDGFVALFRNHDRPLSNAEQLEDEIAKLSEFRRRIVGTWPWTTGKLPPVDRNMVLESRRSRQPDGGRPIEDLIRELGGKPTRE